MINITFDKASEYLWLRTVIECGALNCRDSMRELVDKYMGNMKTDELFHGKRMVIQCYKEEDDE